MHTPPPQNWSTRQSSGAAQGSGKGYYYAAVTSDKQTMPTLAPKKIDPAEVKASAESEDEPIAAKSNYYYAHRRKIDFHVPTPAPKRID